MFITTLVSVLLSVGAPSESELLAKLQKQLQDIIVNADPNEPVPIRVCIEGVCATCTGSLSNFHCSLGSCYVDYVDGEWAKGC